MIFLWEYVCLTWNPFAVYNNVTSQTLVRAYTRISSVRLVDDDPIVINVCRP